MAAIAHSVRGNPARDKLLSQMNAPVPQALLDRTALLLQQGHKVTRINAAGRVIAKKSGPCEFYVIEDYMPTGDLGLDQPNHRAADLARALGARKMRRNGKVRYFLGPRKAEQFAALYAAGFWAVRRGGAVHFRRDPRPLGLYAALAVCRIPLDGNCGLTAKAAEGSLAAKTEPIHTD